MPTAGSNTGTWSRRPIDRPVTDPRGHSILAVSPEVVEALAERRPVVALESTIISHGMPYPKNLETALAVEDVVRAQGAVPATVAVADGRLVVGADRSLLEKLATAENVAKVSRRDLSTVLAFGELGATTVAATMIGAARAGIDVFATGGIGGVHRGAWATFDVSADLQELARTPVAVVCAGVKSILDIGLTLEYLETHGVPVIGFGTDEMPAFYASSSGHSVTRRIDEASDVARVIALRKWLGGGTVIANPIPPEHSLDRDMVDALIEQALREASDRGIRGPQTTPFLLERVAELSGAESLDANIALVEANAAVAAQIAVAASQM